MLPQAVGRCMVLASAMPYDGSQYDLRPEEFIVMNTSEKLALLREKIQAAQLDYYFVPSSDAHQNEYVPPCWQRRVWVSGFTGSAGDALVGREQAYLWTDGRYFLQADQELDAAHYQLMKQMQGVAAPIHEWLATTAKGARLGVDPRVLTVAQQQRFEQALVASGGELVAVEDNWIDALWAEQAALPQAPIHLVPEKYSGESTQAKLLRLRAALAEQGAAAVALNVLDQIAWLFNLRGEDIPFNPVAISYAFITQSEATLYIDAAKVSTEVRQQLASEGVCLAPYEAYADALAAFEGAVLLDPEAASWWMARQLKRATVMLAACPIVMMKALKNTTEQAGMREAHRQDGVAICRFLAWLEAHWADGVSELSAASKLALFRRESDDCRGLSFETISGFAAHGAIIHYSADEASDIGIDDSSLYLVDSGGQYWQGTTDITRTVHLGEPSLVQKQMYTAVLKGHLAMARQRFPEGAAGRDLDPLARQHLWQLQLDYAHGTGHGVGCYLCVHEGPQRIARGGPATLVPLVPGMVVSNEPGFYWPDHWGIRIENLCLVTSCEEDKPVTDLGFGPFLQFEDLTLAPYCRRLIEVDQLDAVEVRQINAYHERVYQQLQRGLNDSERAWLQAETAPL